jgi:hypothetical protein
MIYRDNAYPAHYRGHRGNWAIPFSELQARTHRVQEDLRSRGLYPGEEHWPDDYAHLESGHKVGFHLDPERNRWTMMTHHGGDPTGATGWSDLGDDDERVGDRALRELRHPDVVRFMGGQMQRAAEGGDPYGFGGHPAQWSDVQKNSVRFRHYG